MACAGCCAVPVLIIAGVIGVGTVLGSGAAVGGIAALAVVTHRVVSNRVGQTRAVIRLSLAAAATAIAVAGLLGAQRFLLVLGFTGLGIAALLALSDARGVARDHCGWSCPSVRTAERVAGTKVR